MKAGERFYQLGFKSGAFVALTGNVPLQRETVILGRRACGPGGSRGSRS